MKAHQWWLGCVIVFAAMMLPSCTQAQIEQVLQNKTQDMISGPCPPGNGPLGAVPEFCMYVTEVRLVNEASQADVSVTIVNRTGRRIFLSLKGEPYLTDDGGTQWKMSTKTGIDYFTYGAPMSLEPNGDSQISFLFARGNQGSTDVTFSMRGAIAILAVTPTGQPSINPPPTVRGFNIAGLHQAPLAAAPAPQAAAAPATPTSPVPATGVQSPGPCSQGAGPVSALAEFCMYVTEVRLVNEASQADVSVTIVNRTGRRIFLSLKGEPYLTDDGGTQWKMSTKTGIDYFTYGAPMSLEPNGDSQISFLFARGNQGSTDVTFSMRGAIAILAVTPTGQPSINPPPTVRGFNIAGLRPVQQQPQAGAPTSQNTETTPTQFSPLGAGLAAPEVSASSPSSTQGAVVGATSTSLNVDIVGLRLGMTPEEVRQTMLQHDKNFKIKVQRASLQGLPGTTFLSEVIGGLDRRLPVGALDSIGVHFPPPPHKSRAIFIQRFTGFEENKQPLITAIKDGLIKKYGTPSFTADMGGEIYLQWAYDPSGARIIDSMREQKCIRFNVSDPQNMPNVFFERIKSNGCGVTILATTERNETGPGQRGQLARYLSIYIIDDSAFPAMRDATKSYADTAVRDSAKQVPVPKF